MSFYFLLFLALLAAVNLWSIVWLVRLNRRILADYGGCIDLCESMSESLRKADADIALIIAHGFFPDMKGRFGKRGVVPHHLAAKLNYLIPRQK